VTDRTRGPEPTRFTRDDIRRLFELLDEELASQGIEGEVYLVGGAVMCLALDARPATRDVDAFFRPTREVREAAARVAAKAGVPDNWLNDAVKGFLSPDGDFDPYLELPHLRVFVARPEYLLAMKCAAMRLGEEFHDLEDVRYLLRYLNITTAEEALGIVTRYFDEDRLPPKTRLALEELLSR
jgi:predicted nucleotidyltransferase